MLSIERRVVFTVADLAPVAHGHAAFVGQLCPHSVGASATDGPGACGLPLRGERVPIDFAQCMRYERTEELELWCLTRCALCAPPSDAACDAAGQ